MSPVLRGVFHVTILQSQSISRDPIIMDCLCSRETSSLRVTQSRRWGRTSTWTWRSSSFWCFSIWAINGQTESMCFALCEIEYKYWPYCRLFAVPLHPTHARWRSQRPCHQDTRPDSGAPGFFPGLCPGKVGQPPVPRPGTNAHASLLRCLCGGFLLFLMGTYGRRFLHYVLCTLLYARLEYDWPCRASFPWWQPLNIAWKKRDRRRKAYKNQFLSFKFSISEMFKIWAMKRSEWSL